MNRHVGITFTLSYLVVGLVAVVFYQPEGEPAPAAASRANATPAAGKWSDESVRPVPMAPTPGPTTIPVATKPSHQSVAALGGPLAPAPSDRAALHVIAPVSRRAPDRKPRSAFTEVNPGESLIDIAVRVYGSADDCEALWLANRDLLDRQDSPISAGTLLRTP